MSAQRAAVDMLKAIAKSIDGTGTEERINEVIAILEETARASPTAGPPQPPDRDAVVERLTLIAGLEPLTTVRVERSDLVAVLRRLEIAEDSLMGDDL